MDLQVYMTEQAIILIPVLYVLGYIIKQSMVNNKYIPLILLMTGIGMAIALLGVSIQSAMQGIIAAGLTVTTDQVFKQLGKDN